MTRLSQSAPNGGLGFALARDWAFLQRERTLGKKLAVSCPLSRPELGFAVVASGGDSLAVGVEGHGGDGLVGAVGASLQHRQSLHRTWRRASRPFSRHQTAPVHRFPQEAVLVV